MYKRLTLPETTDYYLRWSGEIMNIRTINTLFSASLLLILLSTHSVSAEDSAWKDTTESAKKAIEASKETGVKAWEATKETGAGVWEKTKSVGEDVKEGTKDLGKAVKEDGKAVWEDTKKTSQEASVSWWQQVRDFFN
jgi:hypothetical protein